MSPSRIKVVFRQTVDVQTMEMFATVLEIFGRVYRTQHARSLGVIPGDARKASNLTLQLREWQEEGAVESWARAA